MPHTETPLAARMRPTTLDEVVGQEHLIGEGKLPSEHGMIVLNACNAFGSRNEIEHLYACDAALFDH